MPDGRAPPPPRIDDEPLLVLRARGGDAAAFEQLVARYHRRVHYYLRKMLPKGGRTDDAAQDLWFDVWRSLAKLRDPAAFAPWLYRLARDRAYRDLRRRRPHADELAVGDLAATDDGPTVEDEFFRAEDADRVHAGLDRLSPEHRDVLLLRFVEQMTYPQIAGVTGCEVGTVRSRLHYAKRALKEILEQETRHDNAKPTRVPTA